MSKFDMNKLMDRLALLILASMLALNGLAIYVLLMQVQVESYLALATLSRRDLYILIPSFLIGIGALGALCVSQNPRALDGVGGALMCLTLIMLAFSLSSSFFLGQTVAFSLAASVAARRATRFSSNRLPSDEVEG